MAATGADVGVMGASAVPRPARDRSRWVVAVLIVAASVVAQVVGVEALPVIDLLQLVLA